MRPIRRTKQWLCVLLKDTSVTAGDSNPHSADQKHQSLNSVLLKRQDNRLTQWQPKTTGGRKRGRKAKGTEETGGELCFTVHIH